MRTGVVIQARTSSTRLPGKVLKELPLHSGVPVLRRIIDRVRRVAAVDTVIVATSDRADDDPVALVADAADVACYRGPLEDVLSRFVGAALEHRLDRIVRVTADCPCVDSGLLLELLELQTRTGAEFCTNLVPRSYPKGLDLELVTASALSRMDREATSREDREHVCTYAYRTAPERFRTANLEAPAELRDPELRVTLDTLADYALLAGIYDLLGAEFTARELMALFAARPWLRLIAPASETK